MTLTDKYILSPAHAVQNAAISTKNWVVANQDQILSVLKVVAIAAIILGSGYAIASLAGASLFSTTELSTLGGCCWYGDMSLSSFVTVNWILGEAGIAKGVACAVMGVLMKHFIDNAQAARAAALSRAAFENTVSVNEATLGVVPGQNNSN